MLHFCCPQMNSNCETRLSSHLCKWMSSRGAEYICDSSEMKAVINAHSIVKETCPCPPSERRELLRLHLSLAGLLTGSWARQPRARLLFNLPTSQKLHRSNYNTHPGVRRPAGEGLHLYFSLSRTNICPDSRAVLLAWAAFHP